MTQQRILICRWIVALATLHFSQSIWAEPPNCMMCGYDLSEYKPGKGDPCKDLFSAACLNSDGKSKYEGSADQIKAKLEKKKLEAQQVTLKAMGYKDANEAIKAKLEGSGLKLTDEAKSKSLEEIAKAPGGNPNEKMFADNDSCSKSSKLSISPEFYKEMDVAKINEYSVKLKAADAKAKEQSQLLFARDVNSFFSVQVAQKCEIFKSMGVPAGSNPDLETLCARKNEIRREAIHLFLEEGSKDYDKKALAFVKKYSTSSISQPSPYGFSGPTGYGAGAGMGGYGGYPAGSAPGAPVPTVPQEVLDARMKVSMDSMALNSSCATLNQATDNVSNKILIDLMTEVTRAKTTVDSLVDLNFTNDRREKAQALYSGIKEDVQDLVGQMVKDSSKKGMIQSEYDTMKLNWLEKPDASYYTKNSQGRLVLNDQNVEDPVSGGPVEFYDPKLTFFTELNAFYTPDHATGKMKVGERVNLNPGMLEMMDQNPFAVLNVLAHEAGHKIGPVISRVNGHNLQPEYAEILSCYKDSKSIKLENGQDDETISDYISSEVLAKQIQKLPMADRKNALIASMETMCTYDDMNEKGPKLECKAKHPVPYLRINGIFGASPNLREAVGCQGESDKFKSCGMKSIALTADVPTGSTAPKAKKGTK